MPVYFYLGRDLRGQYSEPVFQHESRGIQRICRHLWRSFQNSNDTVAVITNIKAIGSKRKLSPDMVILTRLGIGILELKDHFGQINCSQPKGPWYAGKVKMMDSEGNVAEKAEKPVNPAQQVRTYARVIHEELLSNNPEAWLPGEHNSWQDMKLHTGVCFTNLLADISGCEKTIIKNYPPKKELAEWEILSVLNPASVSSWVFDLRFNLNTGRTGGFHTQHLYPGEVTGLAERFFHGIRWQAMESFLLAHPPIYASLDLLDTSGKTVFRYYLDQDDMLAGRAEGCAIQISPDFHSVSRHHARIIRTNQGIFMEDTQSKHGTLLNGRACKARMPLHHNDILTLGGVCHLRFTQAQPIVQPTSMENTL